MRITFSSVLGFIGLVGLVACPKPADPVVEAAPEVVETPAASGAPTSQFDARLKAWAEGKSAAELGLLEGPGVNQVEVQIGLLQSIEELEEQHYEEFTVLGVHNFFFEPWALYASIDRRQWEELRNHPMVIAIDARDAVHRGQLHREVAGWVKGEELSTSFKPPNEDGTLTVTVSLARYPDAGFATKMEEAGGILKDDVTDPEMGAIVFVDITKESVDAIRQISDVIVIEPIGVTHLRSADKAHE